MHHEVSEKFETFLVCRCSSLLLDEMAMTFNGLHAESIEI